MAPSAHALLTASGSHCWLHCTRSPRLCEGLPDSTSPFAEEGTLAHELCEAMVTKHFGLAHEIERPIAEIKADPKFKAEMTGCAEEYLEHIIETVNGYDSKPYVAVEVKLDLSDWIPEGFGTSDCVLISDKDLHVIDYKHGKGVVVDAEENPQLQLYALGAYKRYSAFYQIDNVFLHIVQPRAGGCSTWSTSAGALLLWGEHVRQRARLAWAGEGDFAPGTDTCRWCKVKTTCRARLASLVDAMHRDEWLENKPLLDNDEMGELLTIAGPVIDWYGSLKEGVEAKLLGGERVKGYKLVAGRTTRGWTDQAKAFQAIQADGIPEDMLYERSPLSVAKAEKVLGKKDFAKFSEFVRKSEGKPTVVPESDKRDAYIPGADKLNAFVKAEKEN